MAVLISGFLIITLRGRYPIPAPIGVWLQGLPHGHRDVGFTEPDGVEAVRGQPHGPGVTEPLIPATAGEAEAELPEGFPLHLRLIEPPVDLTGPLEHRLDLGVAPGRPVPWRVEVVPTVCGHVQDTPTPPCRVTVQGPRCRVTPTLAETRG